MLSRIAIIGGAGSLGWRIGFDLSQAAIIERLVGSSCRRRGPPDGVGRQAQGLPEGGRGPWGLGLRPVGRLFTVFGHLTSPFATAPEGGRPILALPLGHPPIGADIRPRRATPEEGGWREVRRQTFLSAPRYMG